MKTLNYEKSKIRKNTKRLHALLHLEVYKNLVRQSQKYEMTMTDYITMLISNSNESNHTSNNQSELNKLISLINFHKKLYIDLNATFSNLNQIAMRLNIDNIKEELQETISQSDFYANTIKTLEENKKALKEIREVVISINQQLNALYKKSTQKRKPKKINIDETNISEEIA